MRKSFDEIIENKVKDYNEIIDALNIEDTPKKILKTNWTTTIELMEVLTTKYYRRANFAIVIIIVCGILVPVTINLIPNEMAAKITATVLGLVSSVTTGINQYFRFGDRWKHFRTKAEELKIEGEQYLSLSGLYKDFSRHDGEAFKVFMSNVSIIKAAQISEFSRKIAAANDPKDKDVQGTDSRDNADSK